MRAGTFLLVILGGCVTRPSGGVRSETPQAAIVPSDALPSTNRETGESLELTIPVLDGDPIALSSLRGKVVVLELTATWVDGFGASEDAYRAMQESHPDAVQVVEVGMDVERSALDAHWSDVLPATRWRAWDPQGALAAQLQAAKLPTVIVLNRDGTIRQIWGGIHPEQVDEVAKAVDAALE